MLVKKNLELLTSRGSKERKILNLIQLIQKTLESYEFPNSVDYQAPNVCYTAMEKDEIPKRILEGLREAWSYNVSIE